MHSSRFGFLLLASLVIAASGAACGTSTGSVFHGMPYDASAVDAAGDVSTTFFNDGPHFVGDDASGDDASGPLVISPANTSIDVNLGQQTPTVSYSATVGGVAVAASFAIDRGEIGSVNAASGVMTPSGNVGGTANITATYGAQSIATPLTVHLHLVDNGAPGATGANDGGVAEGGAAETGVDDSGVTDSGVIDSGVPDSGATADAGGAGGNGGVGGSGAGGPVASSTVTVLQGAAAADPGLAWLYPYDQTVWPQGLLAPLLQWSPPTAAHAYDSVYIHLQEAAFEYQGYFSANATPFVNAPIPQTAWQALSYSNQGEPVTVTLVFSSGGVAYGPLTETWTIAQGSLTGTVYYNSYGTNLAHNYCCTVDGPKFGGATLAIKHGATSPVLVAGSDSECRVCHSVSANGASLVTVRGPSPYDSTSSYDLLNGYAETQMAPSDGRFGFPGMFPDGTMLINDGAPGSLAGGPVSNGGPAAAQLFNVETGAAVASSGIPSGLQTGSPVFSPDGTHVAFNFSAGTVNGTTADKVSLAAMDYDATTSTFSNFRVLYTPPSGTSVWPSFLPTNDAVVFELETVNNGRDWGGTRSTCDSSGTCSNSGTQAELWWLDLATSTATRLDNLNGKGYLPTLAATLHTDDSTLDYEPTVNPVPSGGYAWVVFTSRRLYGNVATINPWWSDPRYHDLSVTPTPKKLWVAAVDLNAKAGTDPSHPAFYLPAQELLAGNSRGYWVVDPCQASGTSCLTGDECCGGYCEDVDGGFVCSAQPPACSTLNDKCSTATDCCGAAQGVLCINDRCAQPSPQLQ
jgi:hypothetical protein